MCVLCLELTLPVSNGFCDAGPSCTPLWQAGYGHSRVTRHSHSQHKCKLDLKVHLNLAFSRVMSVTEFEAGGCREFHTRCRCIWAQLPAPPIKGTVAVKRDAVSAVQGHCCAELSIKATICGLCSLGEVHSKLLYVSRCPLCLTTAC